MKWNVFHNEYNTIMQGGANGKIPDFVGSNFSSTFVLGTPEAGKHNLNNVNNVQCSVH